MGSLARVLERRGRGKHLRTSPHERLRILYVILYHDCYYKCVHNFTRSGCLVDIYLDSRW